MTSTGLTWRRVLPVLVLAFAGFAFGAAALSWVLTMVLMFRLLPVAEAVFQAVLAVALYPT